MLRVGMFEVLRVPLLRVVVRLFDQCHLHATDPSVQLRRRGPWHRLCGLLSWLPQAAAEVGRKATSEISIESRGECFAGTGHDRLLQYRDYWARSHVKRDLLP